jgi:hypothetical protein
MTDQSTTLPAERESILERLNKEVNSPSWDGLDTLVGSLSKVDLEDLLLGMSMRMRNDSLVSGRLAYEIRTRTPDGEWGQEVRKLATMCQVSDRTIHRWMSAYQDAAGLELTPAQANSRASADARQHPEGDGSETEYEDDYEDIDEDALAQAFAEDWDPNSGLTGALNLREAVGEPWAEQDSVTPSTKYENPPDSPPPEPRKVLPIDDGWSMFMQSQVVEKQPHLEGVGAKRVAQMRWDEAVRTDPLGLLEDLEMIHEGGVPDQLVEALYAAEEVRAIKPDQVKQPKEKKSGGQSKGKVGASGAKNCENGLIYARELYQHIGQLEAEGGAEAVHSVYGAEVATIQSWQHALGGVLTKVRSAVEEIRRSEKGSGNPQPPAGPDPF